MTFPKQILALACLMSGTLVAQEARVTQLLLKDLTNLPRKEGLMVMVEYPPGSSDAIHRHIQEGPRQPESLSLGRSIQGCWSTVIRPICLEGDV
jgi:hypothetical protein